jgi:hypothetical protein
MDVRNKINILDLNGLSKTELKDQIDYLVRIKHSLQRELQNIEQDWDEKLKEKLEMDRLIGRLKGQNPILEDAGSLMDKSHVDDVNAGQKLQTGIALVFFGSDQSGSGSKTFVLFLCII